jgi:hypothetical protein
VKNSIHPAEEKFILPYQSPQIESQIEILEAYCTLSGEGRRPIQYSEVAESIGISGVTVSGNHKFYTYCGFLENVDGGYRPSESLIEIVKKIEWKKTEQAKRLVRGMFLKKWFVEFLLEVMKPGNKMSEERITNELGIRSGVRRSESNLRRLKRLFEWIEYAGIILESKDGIYELNQDIGNQETRESVEKSVEIREEPAVSGARISQENRYSLAIVINITPETKREEVMKMIELAEECLNEYGVKHEEVQVYEKE